MLGDVWAERGRSKGVGSGRTEAIGNEQRTKAIGWKPRKKVAGPEMQGT